MWIKGFEDESALYYKWQQSFYSFIEETFIELSVSSIQSTLGITEMYKTRFLPSRRVIPIFMTPNLNWEIVTSSTSDYTTELGYILKV